MTSCEACLHQTLGAATDKAVYKKAVIPASALSGQPGTVAAQLLLTKIYFDGVVAFEFGVIVMAEAVICGGSHA